MPNYTWHFNDHRATGYSSLQNADTIFAPYGGHDTGSR